MAPHAVSQAAIFSPPTSPSGGAPSDAASTRGKAADSGSGGGAGAGAGSASKHKKAGPALDALRTNQAGRVTPTSTSSGSYAHANGSRIVPPLASPSGAAPMHTGFVTHKGGRDRVDSDDVDIVEDDFGTTPASAQWARTGPTQARPSRKTGSDTSGSIASTTAGAGGAGAGLSPMSSTMPLAKTVTNNPSASRSAYFARDFTVRVATSCGGHRVFHMGVCVWAQGSDLAGTGILRRLPSDASRHAESRVIMALSSKRLALQRQRRLQIKCVDSVPCNVSWLWHLTRLFVGRVTCVQG